MEKWTNVAAALTDLDARMDAWWERMHRLSIVCWWLVFAVAMLSVFVGYLLVTR